MRRSRLPFLTGFLLSMASLAIPAAARAAEIQGDYLETRSADVWTGPCFANSETGLVGREAIMAWRVDKGAWKGVALDGLSVVGVVKASATLGDPFATPYPAQAVVIVDEKATTAQRVALVAFAQAMGGALLDSVVRTETAPIDMSVRHEGEEARGTLQAGALVDVETRAVGDQDRHCGNEETYYPPLAPTSHAMPAVSLTDRYRGDALGVSWTTHDKRNAFVGHFSR
ncbi:MAG: hypothetical protein DMF78_20900 [Acidobacteria bacterium]|nr:MAG: hypothetical protein DMF78_20900 [Acidobacteriota bacterium]